MMVEVVLVWERVRVARRGATRRWRWTGRASARGGILVVVLATRW